MSYSSKIKSRSQINKLKLTLLLDVTNAINNNLSKVQLFETYRDILVHQLKIGKIQLYTFENEWKLIISEGVDDSVKINPPEDLENIKDILVLNNHKNTVLHQFGVVVPIFHKTKPLAYLLLNDFDGEKIEVSPIIRHLSFIKTLTNIVMVAIENKKLYKEAIEKAAMKRELELASEMQHLLFPSVFPNNENVEIDAFYQPHHEVGGDYYDVIQLSNDEILFCMADVSGKGVSAALLMSNLQASLRVLAHTTSSLFELVNIINHKIQESANKEKYITMFLAKYNFSSRRLNYINAGHIPPLLYEQGRVKELNSGTTILGMFDKLPFVKEGNISINKNAVLLCYTDGVEETENKLGEAFGIDRVKNILIRHSGDEIKNLLNAIMNNIENFKIKEKPYSDDITLMGIRFK